MPESILKITTSYMKLPVAVEIARAGTAAEKVSQELFIVNQDDKRRILGEILKQYHGSTLLFTRTKIGAHKVTRFIKDAGHSVAEIHSDRTFAQRREALDGFKSGRYRILVATDIASRGIDVSGIELVINYDLPDESENYIHRIGRTGRAGSKGHAISLATPDQESDVKSIERLMSAQLPVSSHPQVPAASFTPVFKPAGGHKGGGYKRRSFSPRGRKRW